MFRLRHKEVINGIAYIYLSTQTDLILFYTTFQLYLMSILIGNYIGNSVTKFQIMSKCKQEDMSKWPQRFINFKKNVAEKDYEINIVALILITWWCKYLWEKVSKTENIGPIKNIRKQRWINL